MSLRVDFLSGADADLQEVFNHLESRRDGFGAEFMQAVDAHLARIAIFPKIAPIYLENVRRQVVRQYPYGVFYEPQPTRILIVAILDLRQDPAQISRRLRR